MLAALRRISKKVEVLKIPTDTLIMHRETLLNMYGPTLAAMVRLDDADLDLRQTTEASKAQSSMPKKEKIKNSNLKRKKIAAPQL